jgi:hypothetical protein
MGGKMTIIRRSRWAGSGLAFGLLASSSLGCSAFSADSCKATRTCPKETPDGGRDDAAGLAAGGAAGSGGASGKGGAVPMATGGSAGISGGGSPPSMPVADGGPAPSDGGPDATSGDADATPDAEVDGAADAGPKSCAPGFADCDKDPKNGCEVDLTKTAASCGACGHVCSSAGATAVACVASVCKPTCASGYGNCKTPVSSVADDGCEANLNEARTCGACNHDCLGGACSGQRCQAVTLASGLSEPRGLAADSKYVYWTDRTGGSPRIMYVPVFGGAATLMSNDATDNAFPNPLASNGTYVMWASDNTAGISNPNGAISICFPGAGPMVLSVTSDALSIAIDGTYAYYSSATDGLVHRIKLQSNVNNDEPVSNVTPGAGEMVVDATNVYFLKGIFTLGSLTLGGGPASEVTPQSPGIYSSRLGADTKNLYVWSLDTSTGPVAFNLVRLPKTLLGNPVQVARAPAAYLGAPIATDASSVYFGQPDGVYRVSNAGGMAQRIADSSDIPVQIVVNGGAVYWIDPTTSSGSGAVKKLAVFPN